MRRGNGLSCAEIGAKLSLDAGSSLECGSAGRIPRRSLLEIVRRLWDPATRTLSLLVRCTRPDDCVPFLVRVSGKEPVNSGTPLSHQAATKEPPLATQSPRSDEAELAVHRGERVSLVWEDHGIRTVATAICLDPGREGEVVRARLAHTAHTFRAVVVARGQLRARS